MCVCVCIGFSRFFSILSLNYLVENEIREELNRVTMIESNVKLVDVLFFFFLVLSPCISRRKFLGNLVEILVEEK